MNFQKLSGIYHIIFKLKKDTVIQIGALGRYLFKKGYYVYTGSAQCNLFSRVKRHTLKNKKLHWHIDYFSINENVKFLFAYYINNVSKFDECFKNKNLLLNANFIIPKFGNSDCKFKCPSHLLGFYRLNDILKIITTYSQKINL